MGQVIYPAQVADADAMFEVALEAGAQDVESTNDGHEVICDPNDFNDVRDRLEEKFGTAESAELSWKPQNNVNLDAESAKTLLNLMDALEDNDDVQKVSSNVEIDEEVMEQLSR